MYTVFNEGNLCLLFTSLNPICYTNNYAISGQGVDDWKIARLICWQKKLMFHHSRCAGHHQSQTTVDRMKNIGIKLWAFEHSGASQLFCWLSCKKLLFIVSLPRKKNWMRKNRQIKLQKFRNTPFNSYWSFCTALTTTTITTI